MSIPVITRRIRNIPVPSAPTNGFFTVCKDASSGSTLYKKLFMIYNSIYLRSDWITDASVSMYFYGLYDGPGGGPYDLSNMIMYTLPLTYTELNNRLTTYDASYFDNTTLIPSYVLDNIHITNDGSFRNYNILGSYFNQNSFNGVKGFYQRYCSTVDSCNYVYGMTCLFALYANNSNILTSPYITPSLAKISTDVSNKTYKNISMGSSNDITKFPYMDIFLNPYSSTTGIDYIKYTIDSTNSPSKVYDFLSSRNKAILFKTDIPKINGKLIESFLKLKLPKSQSIKGYMEIHAHVNYDSSWVQGDYSSIRRSYYSTQLSGKSHFQMVGYDIPDDDSGIGYLYFNLTGDRIIRDGGIEWACRNKKTQATIIINDSLNTNTFYDYCSASSITDTTIKMGSGDTNYSLTEKIFYTPTSSYKPEVYFVYQTPPTISIDTSTFNYDIYPGQPISDMTCTIRNTLGGSFYYKFSKSNSVNQNVFDVYVDGSIANYNNEYFLDDTNASQFILKFITDTTNLNTVGNTNVLLDIVWTNTSTGSTTTTNLINGNIFVMDINKISSKYDTSTSITLTKGFSTFDTSRYTMTIDDDINTYYVLSNPSLSNTNKSITFNFLPYQTKFLDSSWYNIKCFYNGSLIYRNKFYVNKHPYVYGTHVTSLDDYVSYSSSFNQATELHTLILGDHYMKFNCENIDLYRNINSILLSVPIVSNTYNITTKPSLYYYIGNNNDWSSNSTGDSSNTIKMNNIKSNKILVCPLDSTYCVYDGGSYEYTIPNDSSCFLDLYNTFRNSNNKVTFIMSFNDNTAVPTNFIYSNYLTNTTNFNYVILGGRKSSDNLKKPLLKVNYERLYS